MENLPVDFMEFLKWIVYGGGGAIAVSWILEKLAWYQEKPADAKRNIFFGIVSAFTVLVYVVLTYVPTNIIDVISPYFGIVAVAFLNIYIGTGYHRASKSSPQIVADKVTVMPFLEAGDATGIGGIHISETEMFDELKG